MTSLRLGRGITRTARAAALLLQILLAMHLPPLLCVSVANGDGVPGEAAAATGATAAAATAAAASGSAAIATTNRTPTATQPSDSAQPAGHTLRRLQTAAEGCGVTGGCATLNACDDGGYEVDCPTPESLVCEHQLPGLNICESPPLSAMLPCWMSEVDGGLTLNQISIPGTHNTMAKGISACLRGGLANHVHTQAWSLRTMLDAGVRAVDIRIRHKEDLSLVLEHGAVELPFSFDEDVAEVLASFLADNPTEAVVMLYQVRDLSTTVSAEETLRGSMAARPDLWLDGPAIPTLDEARGRVVLAQNMAREEQNEFDLGSLDSVSRKKGLIRDFFLESGGGPAAGGPLRVNYFSGTGTYVYPLTVAAGLQNIFQGTNEVVFEFSGGVLGVCLFDFVGEDAIAHVVAQQGTTGPSWDQPEGSPEVGVSGAA